MFVYLDNILIYSPDLETHKRHVHSILQRLYENQLYLKAKKFEFHFNTVSFLGYIFSKGQYHMDPNKEQVD